METCSGQWWKIRAQLTLWEQGKILGEDAGVYSVTGPAQLYTTASVVVRFSG